MGHVTEQDVRGSSDLFHGLNDTWGTRMTFCFDRCKETAREIILNVRDFPRAPGEAE